MDTRYLVEIQRETCFAYGEGSYAWVEALGRSGVHLTCGSASPRHGSNLGGAAGNWERQQ